MVLSLGLLFCFLAMFGWSFGDFFIQKSARKIGNWETLFLVTFTGAIILFPFIYKEIPISFSQVRVVSIILGASLVLFFAALLDLESLKLGKLAVVEPIWSWEIPVGALLAYFIFKENLSLYQVILIVCLVSGLFLVSLRSLDVVKKILLEKAVFLAFASATIMGAANFLIGWGARVTTPLMINWTINVVVALLCLFYILVKKKGKNILKNVKKYPKIIFGMCLFDNLAWIALAYAMVLIPIAIAVSLSESYIIIGVLLGVFINKERIKPHQIMGIVLAVLAAIILAAIS